MEVSLLIMQFDSNLASQAEELRNKTVSEVENAAKMLLPLNSSALNLARTLSTSLNGTGLMFSIIQAKVSKHKHLFLHYSNFHRDFSTDRLLIVFLFA